MRTVIAAWMIGLALQAIAAPAARADIGDRLPNAKLVWERSGNLMFSTIRNFSPQDISTSSEPEHQPRWSPDGTMILFWRDPMGVWVMDADYTNLHQIIPNGMNASWTRDGEYVTAINFENDHQVLQYEFSSQEITIIYDSEDPAYSGGFGAGQVLSQTAELRVGGRYLVTRTRDDGHRLYIIDLEDKLYLHNEQMDRGDCSPAWAPDGSYVMSTSRTTDRPVLKADFDPDGPTLGPSEFYVGIGDICSCHFGVWGHRVSNDGNWVVMSGRNYDIENYDIFAWEIETPQSEVVRLTIDSAEDLDPSLHVGSSCQDNDGDSYGAGADCAGPDCDDGDPAIHPDAPELCNQADDDCDGATDEDWANLGQACTEGTGACEADGTFVCRGDGTGIECDAEAGQPGTEECEGSVDEDCDGTTDEDCDCTPSDTRPCYGGPAGTEDEGECHGGTQSCSGGSWESVCAGQVLPAAEDCGDSRDNDCDGLTDLADTEDCVGNQPPTVDAGADRTAEVSAAIAIDATVSDDGLPDGTLDVQWSQESGPAQAEFDDPLAEDIQATFSVAGDYLLRLTATDGELSAHDEVRINVTEGGPTIEITSPRPGDVWFAGQSRTIEWTTTGISEVVIWYSIDNAETWTPVVENIDDRSPDWGQLTWEVPDQLSGECWIHMESYYSEAPTDAGPFEIVEPVLVGSCATTGRAAPAGFLLWLLVLWATGSRNRRPK